VSFHLKPADPVRTAHSEAVKFAKGEKEKEIWCRHWEKNRQQCELTVLRLPANLSVDLEVVVLEKTAVASGFAKGAGVVRRT
jgi:hypothetical protein